MGLVVAGGDTLLFYMCWSRSLVAQTVKNLPAVQETWIQSLGQGRSPGEGNGYQLQYSCLENSTDRILESHSTWDSKELDKTD